MLSSFIFAYLNSLFIKIDQFRFKYLSIIGLLIINAFSSQFIVNAETFDFGGSTELGFAYEFKIHVDAGKEECFFQEVQAHTNLFVAFQVIKGGDGKAGFGVRDPYNQVVLPYAWKSDAEYEVEYVPQHGVYQFCIDNSLSRFNAKMISLYCSSYKRDEWEKLTDDLKNSDGTVSNITSALQNVDKNIGIMLKSVDHSRRHKANDFMLLESNYNYVNNLSVTFCCIFIFTSIGQVYFLKRMFNDNNSSGSSIYKPSA